MFTLLVVVLRWHAVGIEPISGVIGKIIVCIELQIGVIYELSVQSLEDI